MYNPKKMTYLCSRNLTSEGDKRRQKEIKGDRRRNHKGPKLLSSFFAAASGISTSNSL